MPLPTIHTKDIPDTGLTLETPLDAAWMRTALEGTGVAPSGDPAGRAKVRLDLQGRDVLLTGSFDAKLEMQCVRCLEPATLPVGAPFTLMLKPSPNNARPSRGEEVELEEDELDVDFYENDRVELGEWLREQILLEAPAYPTCPAGCAEPLTAPSPPEPVERGIDPRLAPLMKLSNKE